MSTAKRALLLGLIAATASCSNSDQDPSPGGTSLASEVERACVVTAACGVQAHPRVSNCVSAYLTLDLALARAPIRLQQYRCALAAGGDCERVRACFGAGEECTRQSYRAECRGDVAPACDLIDDRVYEEDCALAGLRCEVKPDAPFAAQCVCHEGFVARCEEDWAVSCERGQPVASNCLERGLRCRDGACVPQPSGESCRNIEYPARCEGSVLALCYDGKVVRRDCADQPWARRCNEERFAQCVTSATECDDELNRCRGDELEACVDGRWRTYDCGALGLGPCQPEGQWANCSAPEQG